MKLRQWCSCSIAAIFLNLRIATSFPSGIKGGLIYGAGVFCVGSLPVFLLAFASFQVSVEIMLSWIVQNLCQYLAAGVAIGAVADACFIVQGSGAHHWRAPGSASTVHLKQKLKELFSPVIACQETLVTA